MGLLVHFCEVRCWGKTGSNASMVRTTRLTQSERAQGDGSSCLRPEQCFVERFDGPVAFADGFFQGRNIDDLDVAP